MTDKSYYSQLRRSIIGIIVAVSLTPLLVLAALGGYQFHSAYKQKVLAHMEQLVYGHQQSIDAFLSGKLAEIRVLTDVAGFDKVRDDAGLAQLLQSLQSRYDGVFVDLGLVNAQGTQVAYSGPFRLGRADYAHALWFQETMQREYYISDVFLGLRGLPHFIVAVKHSWHGQEYILRSTIDFVAFNRLVENVRIGETGLAYIVSRGGEFQTKPRRDVAMTAEFLNDVLTPEQDLRTHRFGQSQPHVHLGKDPATGEDTVFVTASLKNGDWLLVLQQSQDDAFRLFLRARNFALVGIIISTLAIVFMAFVLSKRILNTVVETDQQKEMMNEQVIEAGKLASLGELAAGIAHEINNPVAIMVEEAGWIQDLMEEEDLRASKEADEVLRALSQIRTQGGRCKEITHKLLSFARKIDPTMKRVHINELIEEMAALSEQRARFANVHIATDLADTLPPIEASPSELQQVFLNLINNAIDAMDHHEGGQLKITTRVENHQAVISVADTGQGIPKANLQKIFDPFFTTKPVGKGTGLGLSICYGIIQKMGGEISVSSVLDVGTTFHIRLPLRSAEGEGRSAS
ncbi:MAG: ATP-binding protein [Desulfovibrio sp.]|jgi:two-component system NtrC family sensor kinase